jgi:AraC-like DNA-binding protein
MMNQVLLEPHRWRFTSSLFEKEGRKTHDKDHANWALTHSHSHAYREILVCRRGIGVYRYNGEEFRYEPGDIFLISPREIHDNGYPEWISGVNHLWISMISDSIVIRQCEIHSGREEALESSYHIRNNDQICGLAEYVWPLENPLPVLPLNIVRIRIAGFLGILFTSIYEILETAAGTRSGAQELPGFIDAVCRHIADTAGRGESLDSLAGLAGYSRYHFWREFKRHTGKTVHEYVNDVRRRKLADLTEQGMPQKEIARVLGFSNTSSFSRWRKILRD